MPTCIYHLTAHGLVVVRDSAAHEEGEGCRDVSRAPGCRARLQREGGAAPGLPGAQPPVLAQQL